MRLAFVVLPSLVAAVLGGLAGGLSCATTPAAASLAQRARLEELSAALAQAGLSVPLPPRICEEPIAPDAVRFDDEVGCVSAPPGAKETDVVTVYARAIVARRLPDAPEARADALARAFLEGDPAFPALAAAIEAEFDARRLARAKAPKPRAKPKARPRPKDAVVVDAGTSADGGPARGPPVVIEDEGEDEDIDDDVDAGPRPRTVRERLIGTWVTTKPGPIVQVHSLCGSGDWAVRFEATNEAGRMVVGELEPIRGTWEVVDGDPPRITLTAGDGETQEGTVATLREDVAVFAIEGDDPERIRLSRRSKTASCD